MHDGWPDLAGGTGPLLFCCLAAEDISPLLELPQRLFEGAVLVGTYENLQALSQACKVRVLPIAHWEDWFVVKAHG